MSVATKYQGGAKNEVTYGTPVAVDRFFEVVSDSMEMEYGRIESKGIRAGTGVQRSAGFVPYPLGATGDIVFEVVTKGFGFWLQHMLGTVVTTGPVTLRYTHSGTLGATAPGKFTWQRNAPFFATDANQPMTFHGMKVKAWEITNSVEGLLMLKLTCDAEDMDTATALAVASYPTGADLFSFVGGTCTVAGSSFKVTDAMVGVDLGMKIDRRYIRGSALKDEPLRVGMPDISWALAADFDDLTQLNRVASATAAGALASIVLTWVGPTVIPGSPLFPEVVVTIDSARFDKGFPTVGGPEALKQSLSGKGTDDLTDPPISVVYKSGDVTP